MIIEYCRNDDHNFGDDLNSWLWPKLLGDCLDPADNIYFVGIGTLLTEKRFSKTLARASKIVVFTSGTWERELPELNQRCKIYGVRGPRTAKRLGLPSDLVVGDGAYLLRQFDFGTIKKRYRTAFIPHHRSEQYVDWSTVCREAGIAFISTRQPVESFISEVRSCEKIISEAMHGAITADLYRIPWIGARFASNFNEDKWLDWCGSLDIDLKLHTLPLVYQYPPPLMKSAGNAFKRKLPKIFSKSEKWGKLPVSFRKASKAQLKYLSNSLRELENDAPANLSREDKLHELTRHLQVKVEEIRADYLSNSL